jgi:hypothetical protein
MAPSGSRRRRSWKRSSTASSTARRADGRRYRRPRPRAQTEDLGDDRKPISFLGGAPDISRSDIRPLLRTQLRRLQAEAGSAAARTGDTVARAHLVDAAERIERILDPDD